MTSTCPCCGSEVDTSSTEAQIAEVQDHLGLPKAEAILFLALWAQRGRTVLTDVLANQIDFYMGRDLSAGSLVQTKKRLVRSLRPHPLTIEPVYGSGYKLKLTDENWNWKDLWKP